MSKSVHRTNRRALQRQTPDERRLLDAILDTPHLADVVPRLQPELLHRLIERRGLEDSAELVALATPAQLADIFDLDLWRLARPGLDEQFDADRFGVWLEVLAEAGATVAAQKLAAMDIELVIVGLTQHVRVFDRAAAAPYTTTGGEEVAGIRDLDNGVASVVGGYLLVPRRTDASTPWDAIVDILTALDAEHRDFFHQAMRGCRRLSNSGAELDGLHDLLDDGEQLMFDVAFERERRREGRGYVMPAQARAFLQMSRQVELAPGVLPSVNPIAREYFRRDSESTALQKADILATSGEELGFLVNTLMSGCTLQGRSFTAQEAFDAAVAVCKLGRENWPGAPLPDDRPAGRDLVAVFQIGWTALHDDVCMYAAGRLIEVLTTLHCDDEETRAGLDALRIEMTKCWRAGTPWRARDALDVIAILDMPAWAALLALIDECPVMHAAIAASQTARARAISPSAFEFISGNSQIASIRRFLDSLPEILRS